MKIAVAYEEGRVPVTVFQVEGSITVDNYERLQQKAESVVRDGTHCILLDLAGVSLLSSAGLRAIHYVFNLLRTDLPTESNKAVQKGMKDGTFKSPHLKIVNPRKQALSTLEMAGYDMFLDIYSDRQEALASF
ncbi:STAS domain-containing protein [Chloroflexota bacterium]